MSNGDGPTTLADWVSYLHAAAQVKPGHADYQEAQDAIGQALRHINALNVGATETDLNADQDVGAGKAVVAGLLQGGSLGVGEPLSGLASLVQGKGFGEGARNYRESLGTIEAAHPYLTAGAETVGEGALSLYGGARAGAKGLQAGTPLTLRQGALRIAKGAATGAVPAGVAGFSAGGADPTNLGQRFDRAGRDALLGAVLGAGGATLALPRVRAHVEHVADIANKGVMRALQRQRLTNAEAVGARFTTVKPEPPDVLGSIEPELRSRPDVQAAVRDFQSGDLDQEGLETALEAERRGQAIRSGAARRSGDAPSQGAEAPPPIQGPGGSVDLTPSGTRIPEGPMDSPTFLRRQAPTTPEPAWTESTRARVQKGATKGQLAWRADKFGPSNLKAATPDDLFAGAKATEPGSTLRHAIEQELLRRGLAYSDYSP